MTFNNTQTRTKAGTGSLRAVAERKSERHPNYKGSLTIRGEKFWLSGWKRVDDATGESWLSLSVEHADQPAEPPTTVQRPFNDQRTMPTGAARAAAQPMARPATRTGTWREDW